MTTPIPPRYPVVVPGVGPTRARGMIIGEAPGRNEIEQGVPFCGASGRVLDEALVSAGADRDRFFVTNLFKGDVGKGDPDPTAKQIADHRGFLAQEMMDVQPMAILLVGALATREFFPMCDQLASWVGRGIQLGRILWVPNWHAAYTLRRPSARPEFDRAVQVFVDRCVDRT